MKLAVFGSPVRHSLSPVMQNVALAAAGIDGDYVAMDVDGEAFRTGVAAMRSGELNGANVTMPHKALAYDLCDVRSPEAERAGAVNTLAVVGSDLIGANTDVQGIAAAWRWCELPDDGPINIVGSGGAAAAALVALAGRDLWVVARRVDRAVAMVERTEVEARVRGWDDRMRDGVLVNATPIGMGGELLPDNILSSAQGLFDMAYRDGATPAVAKLRARGMAVAEGLDMLIGQAVGSFKIWTGVAIDPAVMRAAAEGELLRRSMEDAE